MLAVIYLILVGVLAGQLQSRGTWLAAFKGLPRYLAALGLMLFLANWANFLLYVLLGWGRSYLVLSWVALVPAVLYFAMVRASPRAQGPASLPAAGDWGWFNFRCWDGWFLFLAGFVLIRFYLGLAVDDAGAIWSNFNFTDTAFHLSVVNAFLEAPRFPPMDLDLAPYPLKYHFLSDFHVAHLVRLGLSPLKAIWLMNFISGAVLVGTLWATFERWLKLPSRWVMLAGAIFLFLNPAVINLIHFLSLNPPFFNLESPFDGLLRFPYFNFESSLYNLFEPQRGLLFAFPIALLVLHAIFGENEDLTEERSLGQARTRTLQAFGLICLLPLAHIVAFAVLVPSLLPRLWRHRNWFLARYRVWLPVFAVGVLQLWYLLCYGPRSNAGYSAWDVAKVLPLQEFRALPAFSRRLAFWFFIDGDFLVWGLGFGLLALGFHLWKRGGNRTPSHLEEFLRQWRWYFAVVLFFFVLLNFYRYSFAWGDSNKFILFLNLGLTLVMVLGAASWLGRRQRIASHVLWWLLFSLSVAEPGYGLVRGLVAPPYGKILLFHQNGRAAAAWLKRSTPPGTLVLTAAYNDVHVVTSLAGRPTPAGIYGDSNPYRQDERQEQIRRIYEDDDLSLLPALKVSYICIAANERRKYHLSPKWTERMQSGEAVAFHAGGDPEDYESAFIFDVSRLMAAGPRGENK